MPAETSVTKYVLERARDTVRDFAGGAMGDLNSSFARLATVTYKRAWRKGPDHPSIKRVTEILRKAADEIEHTWERPESSGPDKT